MFIPQLRWKIIGFEPSPSHIIGSSNVIPRKPVQYKYIYLILYYTILINISIFYYPSTSNSSNPSTIHDYNIYIYLLTTTATQPKLGPPPRVQRPLPIHLHHDAAALAQEFVAHFAIRTEQYVVGTFNPKILGSTTARQCHIRLPSQSVCCDHSRKRHLTCGYCMLLSLLHHWDAHQIGACPGEKRPCKTATAPPSMEAP